MALSKTELYLKNINEKIKNRNICAWKIWFGWLLSIPLFLCGGVFMGLGYAFNSYNPNGVMIGLAVVFYLAGFLSIIINMIIGIIALYKSTKDCE